MTIDTEQLTEARQTPDAQQPTVSAEPYPTMNHPPFTPQELAELDNWNGPLLPWEPIDHQHLIEHGTDKGYQQHRRYGIPYCEPCREAHRELRRQDRAA